MKFQSIWRGRPCQFLILKQMLEAHGDSDECLLWPYNKRADGYGYLYFEGNRWRAHRLAFFFTRGGLAEDKILMHRCDTRACFNPKHLTEGTQSDNHRDMCHKGRNGANHGPNPLNRGEGNGHSKLTVHAVLQIRARAATESHAALASEFGISTTYIWQIVKRERWAHI